MQARATPYQWRVQDFPEEGRQPSGYDFIKISRKLHEIKENSVPVGDPPYIRHCLSQYENWVFDEV